MSKKESAKKVKTVKDKVDALKLKQSEVGALIIKYLKMEGVDHIFGIPGGGLMNFLVDLKNQDHSIKYVIGRQETGSAYMADGYYRVTGKMGVVVVTTGPGATNALTGVMNAQADGSGVLLITGEIDSKWGGLGYLQEGIDATLDINGVYKASVGYSAAIQSGEDANTLIKQAIRNVMSTPRKAAHISLPVDVAADQVSSVTAVPDKVDEYRTKYTGAPWAEAKDAMEALLACKRPLIFLGNGCREALREEKTFNALMKFVETYAIPVMTTADGKGLFPEDHEMSLRVYGMANCMWPYYYLNPENEVPYDGLMVIGSQLGGLSTNKWSTLLVPSGEEAPFIQVDVNQSVIARSFAVSHGIIGEAGSFIEHLGALMHTHKTDIKNEINNRRKSIVALKAKYSPFEKPGLYAKLGSPCSPPSIMRVLQNTMPEDSKIFVDAGNCVGWSVHYLNIKPPMEIFTSLSMGPMGFAVGAVVGGKIGRPDKTCIALTGDGAFMMQGSEVSTAKQYNVGAIWIVLNDNDLAMVTQGMQQFFPKRNWQGEYALGAPDLVKYSEGLGADAYEVNKPEDLEEIMPTVLKRANEDGVPQVVVINVDPHLIPPYYLDIYSGNPH
jgi:acetolactate synthase-1/2/3 large subunit